MRALHRMLGIFERMRAPIDHGASIISMVGLFGLMAIAGLITADVVLRFLFNSPIQGVDDIGHLVMASVIAACFPAGIVRRHNIAIRFLGNAIGRRGSAFLDSIGAFALLAMFALIAWQLVLYSNELADTHARAWVLGWSKAPWWTATAVLVAACVPLQALVAVEHLVRAMTGQFVQEHVPPPLDQDEQVDEMLSPGGGAR